MPNDPTTRTVLGLQRAAGNRAVTRMLARYESAEHQDMGDLFSRELAKWITTEEGRKWVEKHGLGKDVEGMSEDWIALGKRQLGGAARNLTPGQIVALMGDFFETHRKFTDASKAELDELVMAIALEGKHKLDNPNARYEEITKKHRKDSNQHYLALAERNSNHFTPGNRREWMKLHLEALRLAAAPAEPGEFKKRFSAKRSEGQGAAHDKAFEKALFIDAAAGHFLTDGFAAGHLFDKDKLEREITDRMKTQAARPANPEMQAYYAFVGSKMPQLVLKNVHDRLNHEGFDVCNGRGMRWRTYGDEKLYKSKETQRIAALALYVSRQQVYAARRGENPDPGDVLSLLPDQASLDRAWKVAVSYIPTAIEEIGDLIHRQRKMVNTKIPWPIGKIVESNIDTIGDPGRVKQLEEIQERAQRTKQPEPAPQFTILRF